jgi:hypothetical protein
METLVTDGKCQIFALNFRWNFASKYNYLKFWISHSTCHSYSTNMGITNSTLLSYVCAGAGSAFLVPFLAGIIQTE